MWFEYIKEYYNMGFYTNENVKVFVMAGMITEEDYKAITGEKHAS